VLRLPDALRAEIEARARAGYPLESCGLLIGRPGEARTEVVRVVPARNVERERPHDRYEVDPATFVASDGAARAEGLEVVGLWHSHPDHPAEPSETDRASAWTGWSYVIVSVTREGVADLRSWHFTGKRFVEEEARACA